ncbi:MAG: hypothetical protein VKJ04_07360 [Vampirovibrionales bacterium]|nr:hypothetical protein [Vampirovibrionales bacterium]
MPDDEDIQHALHELEKAPGRCPIRRVKSFFVAIISQIRRHPFWSVLVIISGVLACPICEYFAAMIFAAGIIGAIRHNCSQPSDTK